MEEERRLCYVGMTRAEKRLFLTWACFRRRFGGGQPEPSIPSRFLNEVPRTLVEHLGRGGAPSVPQVELYAERSYVRETAKRNLYTGKTYNSVENISNFFAERGMPPPSGLQRPAASAPTSSVAGVNNTNRPPAPSGTTSTPPPRPPQTQQQSLYPQQPPRPSAPPKPAAAAARPSSSAKKPAGIGAGSIIRHPKYGRGTAPFPGRGPVADRRRPNSPLSPDAADAAQILG